MVAPAKIAEAGTPKRASRPSIEVPSASGTVFCPTISAHIVSETLIRKIAPITATIA